MPFVQPPLIQQRTTGRPNIPMPIYPLLNLFLTHLIAVDLHTRMSRHAYPASTAILMHDNNKDLRPLGRLPDRQLCNLYPFRVVDERAMPATVLITVACIIRGGPSTSMQQSPPERQRSETVPNYSRRSDLEQSYQPMSGQPYSSYSVGPDASGKFPPSRTSGHLYYSGRPTYSADVHFQTSEFPMGHPEEPSATGLPGYADSSSYYHNEHPPIAEHPREPSEAYTYDPQTIPDRPHWQGVTRHFP